LNARRARLCKRRRSQSGPPVQDDGPATITSTPSASIGTALPSSAAFPRRSTPVPAPVLVKGGVLALLADPAAFNAAAVGARGRTLVWRDPEGDEINLCADALWRLAHHGAIEAA